jgi:hypothetical protein
MVRVDVLVVPATRHGEAETFFNDSSSHGVDIVPETENVSGLISNRAAGIFTYLPADTD